MTIAMAGLDTLASTRLKVACSLLMADLVDATVQVWSDEDDRVDLLVASDATSHGLQAMRIAEERHLPLLRLARQQVPDGSVQTLSPTATVKDIAEALRDLIATIMPQPEAAPLPPLLYQLRMDMPARSPVLMELGKLRVLIDTANGIVCLPHDLPLSSMIEHADHPRWQTTRLDSASWRESCSGTLVEYSIEATWWRLACRSGLALALPHADRAGLRAWPPLDATLADPRWLPALACLMQRQYAVAELAHRLGIEVGTVRRLFCFVHASGLAPGGGNGVEDHLAGGNGRTPALRVDASFFSIAKRFGLRLLGLNP